MFLVKFILFFALNLFLNLLFWHSNYFIYFLLLGFAISLSYKFFMILTRGEILLFAMLNFFVYSLYFIFTDNIYDVLVVLNLEWLFIFVPKSILVALSLSHLFILYLLGYNKTKRIEG